MIRRLLFTILSVVLVTTGTVGLVQAPANAALPSKSKWLADVDAAMTGSWKYVDSRVAQGGTKLAINFDIDNTSLATHYDWGKPVGRTLRFAKHARSKGVKLLFNTGRLSGDGRLLRARRQLERAGYVVTHMCGRRQGEDLLASKQRCRQHFIDEGWTLIANVGNRPTDLAGAQNYGRGYKLPDYNKQLA
ncbi:MAG: acid phosphatase [Nocardioidaceae bacterium]|nr:acid phosphatase [Nocardioidaceae bacterium]NUS52158.1 acid phosphatase [Nocardioidaceae bacterium]